MEYREVRFVTSTWIPLEPTFVVPRLFGYQAGVPLIGGVVIVEVGIRCEAEGVAGAGFQLPSIFQVNAGGNCRAEFVVSRGVKFFTGCGRGRKALRWAGIMNEKNGVEAR